MASSNGVRGRSQMFQALFLHNNKRHDVEVLEDKKIDFHRVQEHLKNGGSGFITSKESQKLDLKFRDL
jgi:hypothetical protein